MRDHFRHCWHWYVILLILVAFAVLLVEVTAADDGFLRKRDACVLSGRVPVTYSGVIYCVSAQELFQP